MELTICIWRSTALKCNCTLRYRKTKQYGSQQNLRRQYQVHPWCLASKPSGAPIACCYAVLESQLSKWVSSPATKIFICVRCPLLESRSTGYMTVPMPKSRPFVSISRDYVNDRPAESLRFFHHPSELESKQWSRPAVTRQWSFQTPAEESALSVCLFVLGSCLPCFKQCTPKLCGQWFCPLRSKSYGLMSAYRFYFVLL